MLLSVISFPTLKAKAAGGTIDDFVERCYTVTLDRGSDAKGFSEWKERLLNGKAVGNEIAYGFLFSPEYTGKQKSNKEYVTDLYMLFMGREPDEAGFNDWVGQLEAGKSREEVFAGFANSIEFYDICSSYGITAGSYVIGYDRFQINDVNLFVERLYLTCLGRRGEMAGQKDWVERLLKKEISGIECARCFIQSNEYINKNLSDDEYVENLYIAMMGRTSDAGGKANWLSGLANGMTRDEVFAGFANSPEFANICASYNIDKGSYTAKDIGNIINNEPQQNEPQEEKAYRPVKREYSYGDYVVIDYNYGNDAHTEKRYNKNGVYKGYDYFNEHDDKYLNKTSGGKFYNQKGEFDYEYHFKEEYNADFTKYTFYDYADEFKTLRNYTVYDVEKYTFDNGDYSYDGYHALRGTMYNADGTKDGNLVYSYDKYNRRTKALQYNKDGSLYWEDIVEYYDKVGDETQYKKVETDTRYNYDGSMDRRTITEYNFDGNVIKETLYLGGTLNNYTVNEYNSKGLQTKSTNYDYAGNAQSSNVTEYDASGNNIKTTYYNYLDNTANYTVNKFNSNNNLLKSEYFDKNGKSISVTEYTYDQKGQITRYCYQDGTEKTEYLHEYDSNGNLIKTTVKENGVVTYWVKITYEAY